MRRLSWLAPLLLVGACAGRETPYRFSSPLLGMADVPHRPLLAPPPPGGPDRAAPDATTRVATSLPARRAGVAKTVASHTAAVAVIDVPAAAPAQRSELAAPHKLPKGTPVPAVASINDLRALIGVRDPRVPETAVLAVARILEPGTAPPDQLGALADLVSWANQSGRLHAPSTQALPGDLIVFDRTEGDTEADRIAIVLSRDDRGVAEYMYLANGIWRRGFMDATRPHLRRDDLGKIVNTFHRHGRRYPPKGTRYLAGELAAFVIALH